MRLWVQSNAAIGSPPGREYLESAERHMKEVARQDTEIDFHHSLIPHPPGIVTYHYVNFLHTSLTIKCAIQAEREGYDAFTQEATGDLGYFELREIVDIPVVFPGEYRFHVACLLGNKISFLCMNEANLVRLGEMARQYGVTDRIVPGSCIPLTPSDLQAGFNNPEPIVQAATTELKKLGKQGANVVICAGNPISLLLIENGIKEVDGVIVLDNIAAMVKVSEMIVDLRKLGMRHSVRGPGYAPIPKEELATIRKIYGVE